MPAIPRRAMVLCANPGRLLRYGALFNCCGYFHLSLCLDQQELRRSLDQGFPYDYFLHDGFRLDPACKSTLAMLGRSGKVERFLLVGELDCREKRLLFEWSTGHNLSIRSLSDRPLGHAALAALMARDRSGLDLRGIA
ncbi:MULTISPECIES: hypothetical protein [Pseudomonas aeruginosa group]|uniref:Uncharacterized protein n=3 Tax=Pseudomonas aeruginosa group TaxID=136841 RepID=A0ABD7K6W7_PSEAI|nr:MULTISPECIES: hypothetical protein [Pseudomonas aeruginosa group]VTS63494.1 Uncharacterised protein [Streptococcus dysgalactiae subsp. equisimilis]ABR82049.1 hypothetical protein PSPA7_3858 [Pseudomonas aeruginosa PA7]AVK07792.1 hypothetical protein CSB93_5152 [Pseudomonas paraeruginosa]AVR68654.1 hypothetical protein B7D75_17565 [Pseudomonas paraeruginosa]AWE94155.1 hypothetical protein CSC28_3944 [Pseudomonas paraeruginosa]